MKNWKKMILVFVIAGVALIAYFGFNQPFLARLVLNVD